MEFKTSKTAGEALLIPSKTISVLGKFPSNFIASNKGGFEYSNVIFPFSFFLNVVFPNKSSTFVDFVIGIKTHSNLAICA